MVAAKDAVIAWTPASRSERYQTLGHVALAPRPPRDAVAPFAMWDYAADRHASDPEVIAGLFIRFNTMVVRDGIDPQAAHRVMLEIEEYRDAVSPEIAGADHG